MKWLKKVAAIAKKIWADIEKYVRIAFAVIILLFGIRLFFGGQSPKDEFKKKVEDAKHKNKEVKAEADATVNEAQSTSDDVTKSTDDIKDRKKDRDKKADDIFGGG